MLPGSLRGAARYQIRFSVPNEDAHGAKRMVSAGNRAGDHGSNTRALTVGLAAHGPIG